MKILLAVLLAAVAVPARADSESGRDFVDYFIVQPEPEHSARFETFREACGSLPAAAAVITAQMLEDGVRMTCERLNAEQAPAIVWDVTVGIAELNRNGFGFDTTLQGNRGLYQHTSLVNMWEIKYWLSREQFALSRDRSSADR